MDPILSLAFSIQSSKGLYALLLGSGVSRSARIPTGWDITLDLIRRVAALEGANCEPDPVAWYVGRYEREASYSGLLQSVARTPAERSQVLRRYFEPDHQERERGEKLPTTAHHAIAELVASGYFRVIITTNFDRLVEQALQAKGVQPTVVSSAAQAQGLGALSQLRCLVLKVHGDYLETDIRNTAAELADYDPPLNALLDRVLDEFGLVVSGWSAEYDGALVHAIERSRNRRYSVYWTVIGEPSEPAARLIEFRHAVTVRIESADVFFRRLAEHVGALEKYGAVHPLSIGVAVARLKAYLAEPKKHRIELHDLITESTDQLCTAIAEYRQPRAIDAGGAVLLDEMIKFEKHSELLLGLIVNGMWWGDISQALLWKRVFSRLAAPEGALPGYFRPVNLKLYPSLLALYAAGIACCATENYGLLHEIINGTTIKFPDRSSPLCRELAASLVIDSDRHACR
jgi:SIR2-like domain